MRIRARQGQKKNGSAEEQALGRSRGGFSAKVHILVDGLGNPLRLILTGGQRHDSTQATALLDGFTFARVMADRGYAGQAFIDGLLARAMEPVIPPHQSAKQPRAYDVWLY